MSCPGKLLISYEHFSADAAALQNEVALGGCPAGCQCRCKCCRGVAEKYVAFHKASSFPGFSAFPLEFFFGGGEPQRMMRFRSSDMLLLLQAAQSRDRFWTNMYFKASLQDDFQHIISAFRARRVCVSPEKLAETVDTITAGYRSAVAQLSAAEARGALRPTVAAPFLPGLRCGCEECSTLPWRKLRQVEQHQQRHRLRDNFHCRICYRRFYLQHSLISHLSRKLTAASDELSENLAYKRFLEEQSLRERDEPLPLQVEELVVPVPKGLQFDFLEESVKPPPTRPRTKYTKCPFCQEQYRFSFSHQLHMLKHKLRGTQGERFNCSSCPRSFLTAHFLRKHRRGLLAARRLRLRRFKCRSCRWRFQLWSSLKAHVTRMHQRRKPCLICQLPTLGRCCCAHSAKECREAIKRHRERLRLERGPPKVDRRQPKPMCEVCGQTFATNFHLRDHLNKKHLQRREFTCEICGAAFYSQGLMQTHRRAVHLLMHTVHCDTCNLTIKARGNYQRHLKSKRHLDELAKL
ncbi:hypothetical protein KR018_008925, partial [Drosophila ironensis]